METKTTTQELNERIRKELEARLKEVSPNIKQGLDSLRTASEEIAQNLGIATKNTLYGIFVEEYTKGIVRRINEYSR